MELEKGRHYRYSGLHYIFPNDKGNSTKPITLAQDSTHTHGHTFFVVEGDRNPSVTFAFWSGTMLVLLGLMWANWFCAKPTAGALNTHALSQSHLKVHYPIGNVNSDNTFTFNPEMQPKPTAMTLLLTKFVECRHSSTRLMGQKYSPVHLLEKWFERKKNTFGLALKKI